MLATYFWILPNHIIGLQNMRLYWSGTFLNLQRSKDQHCNKLKKLKQKEALAKEKNCKRLLNEKNMKLLGGVAKKKRKKWTTINWRE